VIGIGGGVGGNAGPAPLSPPMNGRPFEIETTTAAGAVMPAAEAEVQRCRST
jgi:hypothetical protein